VKKAFSLLMNYVGRFLIIAKLGKNLTTTVSPLIHVAPSSRKTEASSGGGGGAMLVTIEPPSTKHPPQLAAPPINDANCCLQPW
jgi:hypothetical protein